MEDSKLGKQAIGCMVSSCRFNARGSECDLDRIEVRPSCNCHSGDESESLCGSYECRES